VLELGEFGEWFQVDSVADVAATPAARALAAEKATRWASGDSNVMMSLTVSAQRANQRSIVRGGEQTLWAESAQIPN